MGAVSVLPVSGDVFFDARDDGRSMRVSWHAHEGLYVVSIWRVGTCVATFQMARSDVVALIDSLVAGLAADPALAP